MSIARRSAALGAALCLVILAAAAAPAATISLGTISNNSRCVTADTDDGSSSEQAYNVSNSACSEPTGGADSNFFRVANSGITSASAAIGSSTSIGFSIDAAVGVDSAVDGQDEYERGKVRYALAFNVTASPIESWSVSLSQNVLGLLGFQGDGAATAVGTQVFGNAGISTIDVDVGATDVSFTPATNSASSNVANTGTQSFGPITASRNDPGVVSGTGNGSFVVTISFDIDAFSNAGCTGIICSSASGGEDAAVLLGYDNVDDCCGGTTDRINADNYSTWGRAVAPDGYNSTYTFSVSTLCGNGTIDGTEQCDTGGANGTPGSCCTSTCTLRPSGFTCRAAAGPCDMAEQCNGVGGACPADAFLPSSTVCRAGSPGELCDQTEMCTGSGVDCPADGVKPSGTTCRTGSGDFCDPTETCDGVNTLCPGDAVRPSGTVCRTGSGDFCDLSETCTGVAGQQCPPNDAPAKAGVVCRAGSGDMCDLSESCTGTPGLTCPGNDAPSKAGVVCRAGSGDMCDVSESCTGTPGQTCPTNDAPGKAGTVCRAGSGDICDVNETCSGSPGATCPANDAASKAGVVCRAGSGDVCDSDDTCTGTPGLTCPANDAASKAGLVCRAGSGDACDVSETCSGTPGAACPSNVIASAGTVCRAAAGVCDIAETCSGTAGQPCPGNAFQPNGSDCSDGLFCNGEETCQTGVCTDNENPCLSSCDESMDACTATCPPAPLAGCRTAAKSLLLLKDKSPDSKDKFLWKWINGAATSIVDFGQPQTITDYALCLYAGGVPIAETVVTSDPQRWRLLAGKGYNYLDVSGSEDGIQKILLKGSTANKSKVFWKGRDVGLPDLTPGTLPLTSGDFPVTIQMVNTATTVCWESVFAESDATRNRSDQLKLKH